MRIPSHKQATEFCHQRGCAVIFRAFLGYAPQSWAAEADDSDDLEEVDVTGSRIVRRDLETNSPLLTIDIEQFENNTFISVEEALNDLPQFMAGGVGTGSNAVTSLQGANGLGSGDAFNSTLLPNNAQALTRGHSVRRSPRRSIIHCSSI